MLLEEAVERTIYHSLREEIVKRGYLPDIYDYDIENTDLAIAKSENIRYNIDLKAIKVDKGFAIEVFNYSNNQSYGDKEVPRIVIHTDSFIPGSLGLDPSRKYEKNVDGSFKVLKSVEMVSDFYFSLNLVANTVSSMRQLHDIMANVLPRRGYIKWYQDNGLRPYSNLLIQYLASADVSFLSEGIMEKVYKYMIPDVHEIDDKTIYDNIPAIINIQVDKDDNNLLNIN